MWQDKKSILMSILATGLVMGWSIAQISPAFAQRAGGRGSGGMSRGGGSMPRGGGSMSRGGGSMSRGGGSMSRGGGSMPRGGSISRGSISRGSSGFSRGSISRGSIPRGSSSFSRGSISRGSIPRGSSSFSRGSISRGSSSFYRSIPRGSISRGSVSRGSVSRGSSSFYPSIPRGSVAHGGRGYSHDGYRPGYSGGAKIRPYYGGYYHGHTRFYFSPYGYGFGYYGPGFGIYLGLPLYRDYDYYTYYTTPYYTTRYYTDYVPYVEQYEAVDSTYAATASTGRPVIPASGKAADFQFQAEQAFREHRYEDAARLSHHALVEDGQNGKLHLFASQTLYALGDYQSAAAAVQQAAALLDRSEWGFVVENYQKFYRGDDYVTQTARLVEFSKKNPDAAYAHFLLGYQYKFLGYDESARKRLTKAVALESRDRLAAELLVMAGGEVPKSAGETAPESPPKEAPPVPGPSLKPAPAASPNQKQ